MPPDILVEMHMTNIGQNIVLIIQGIAIGFLCLKVNSLVKIVHIQHGIIQSKD